MKASLIKASLLAILVMFSGCDSDTISSVKSSEYTDGVSINDLLEDSGYCDSVAWSDIVNKKGRKIVHMECNIATGWAVKNYEILVINFVTQGETVDFFNGHFKNTQGQLTERFRSRTRLDMVMASLYAQLQAK